MSKVKENMQLSKVEPQTVTKLEDEKTNLALIQITLKNDWKGTSDELRGRFVMRLCKQLNLAPVLNPFKFIDMRGKTVLYADSRAVSLIANANRISTEIKEEVWDKDRQILKIYVRASKPDGTFSDNFAALHIATKNGEDHCNAQMKCLTKAKRRAVLSLVDLSIPTSEELKYLERSITGQEVPTEDDVEINNSQKQLVESSHSESIENPDEEARIELMQLITKGDAKKMSLMSKFIADNTQGMALKELDYDQCHQLMAEYNRQMEEALADKPIKKEPEEKPLIDQEQNISPEAQEEMFAGSK